MKKILLYIFHSIQTKKNCIFFFKSVRSFVSAHCASSIKTGSKLMGFCISLVGKSPLADPFTQTKKFGILQCSGSDLNKIIKC